MSLSSVGDGYLTNVVVDDLERLREALEEMVRAAGGDIGDRLECEPIIVPVTYYMPAHGDAVVEGARGLPADAHAHLTLGGVEGEGLEVGAALRRRVGEGAARQAAKARLAGFPPW